MLDGYGRKQRPTASTIASTQPPKSSAIEQSAASRKSEPVSDADNSVHVMTPVQLDSTDLEVLPFSEEERPLSDSSLPFSGVSATLPNATRRVPITIDKRCHSQKDITTMPSLQNNLRDEPYPRKIVYDADDHTRGTLASLPAPHPPNGAKPRRRRRRASHSVPKEDDADRMLQEITALQKEVESGLNQIGDTDDTLISATTMSTRSLHVMADDTFKDRIMNIVVARAHTNMRRSSTTSVLVASTGRGDTFLNSSSTNHTPLLRGREHPTTDQEFSMSFGPTDIVSMTASDEDSQHSIQFDVGSNDIFDSIDRTDKRKIRVYVHLPNHKSTRAIDVLAYYICTICHNPFHKPVSIPSCGHTFCAQCLREASIHWIPNQCPRCASLYDSYPHVNQDVESEVLSLYKSETLQREPAIGSLVCVLLSRGSIQAFEIGFLLRISDGLASQEEDTVFDDRNSVDERTKETLVSARRFYECRIVHVDIAGNAWLGRLCDIDVFDPERYPLATRPLRGSLAISPAMLTRVDTPHDEAIDEEHESSDASLSTLPKMLHPSDKKSRFSAMYKADNESPRSDSSHTPLHIPPAPKRGRTGLSIAAKIRRARRIGAKEFTRPGTPMKPQGVALPSLDTGTDLSFDDLAGTLAEDSPPCPPTETDSAKPQPGPANDAQNISTSNIIDVAAPSHPRFFGYNTHYSTVKAFLHSIATGNVPYDPRVPWYVPSYEFAPIYDRSAAEYCIVTHDESISGVVKVRTLQEDATLTSLRPYMRVCTDLTMWIKARDLCCVGCKMLLRLPVRLRCDHYYCLNCALDSIENGWPCLGCGAPAAIQSSIGTHAPLPSFSEYLARQKELWASSADASAARAASAPIRVAADGDDFKERYLRREKDKEAEAKIANQYIELHNQSRTSFMHNFLPHIDFEKTAQVLRRAPAHKIFLDRFLPVITTKCGETRMGILVDDPHRINVWIMYDHQRQEYVNVHDIEPINVFSNIRPALRANPGLIVTSLRKLHEEQAFCAAGSLKHNMCSSAGSPGVGAPDTPAPVDCNNPSQKLYLRFAYGLAQVRSRRDVFVASRQGNAVVDMMKSRGVLILSCLRVIQDFTIVIDEARRLGYKMQHDKEQALLASLRAKMQKARNAKSAPSGVGAPQSRTHPQPSSAAQSAEGAPADPRNLDIAYREREKVRRKALGLYQNPKEMAKAAAKADTNIMVAESPPDSNAHAQDCGSISILARSFGSEVGAKLLRYAEILYKHPELDFLCSGCARIVRRPIRLSCGCLICRTCAALCYASSIPCLACGMPVPPPISLTSDEVTVRKMIALMKPSLFFFNVDCGCFVIRFGSKLGGKTPVGMVINTAIKDGILVANVVYPSGYQSTKLSELSALNLAGVALAGSDGNTEQNATALNICGITCNILDALQKGSEAPPLRPQKGDPCLVVDGAFAGLVGLLAPQPKDAEHQTMVTVTLETGTTHALPLSCLAKLQLEHSSKKFSDLKEEFLSEEKEARAKHLTSLRNLVALDLEYETNQSARPLVKRRSYTSVSANSIQPADKQIDTPPEAKSPSSHNSVRLPPVHTRLSRNKSTHI